MTATIKPKTWLTLDEAIEHGKMSLSTIRRLIEAGELPAYRLREKGRLLINLAELDALIESSRRVAGEP